MKCSVVIPVYRGEATIETLVERLGKVLPTAAEQFEVILVNDGSPDDSWGVIGRLAKRFDWVRGIRLTRNYGQDNALLGGILDSRFDVLATLDDDLQHAPEDLPRLFGKLSEGYDVVYGVPRIRRQVWWKSLFSTAVKRVISFLTGLAAVQGMSSFRVFRAEAARQAGASISGPDVSVDVLLSWIFTRFAAVEIEEAPRLQGTSNYSLFKLVRLSLRILTNYTTVPLRLASLLGFFFTLVGIGVFLYVVAIYFTLGSIPGFPFLASVITIFSGVQLFGLGIIGEYLARVFERSSGRPHFAIQERLGGGG
jgi:glycosyltransferase involved in cell wall biosynthesis